MEYKEFKEVLLERLQDFYGGDAEVSLHRVQGNNGQEYDGLWIALAEDDGYAGLVASLEDLYEEHGKDGAAGMDACMEAVINAGEQYICSKEARRFMGQLKEWEAIKDKVCPILVNSGWNRGLLEGLISMPLLDLAVVYIVWDEGGRYRTTVSDEMLEHYGIEPEELHRQALANMEQDGYRFLSTVETLKERAGGRAGRSMDGGAGLEAYILTNWKMEQGAAGLLKDRLLRKFAGGRSFYILLVTTDKAVFVPDNGFWVETELDRIMQAVNQIVDTDMRLSDHCYYYDGEKDEIRMRK